MSLIFIIILAIFVVLPLLQIYRQSKNVKAMEQFRSQLTPGTRVETAGGLRGTVLSIHGDSVDLEISEGVTVEWALKGILRPVEQDSADSAAPVDTTTHTAQNDSTIDEASSVDPETFRPKTDNPGN